MKFYHDLDIISVNNITISIFFKCYVSSKMYPARIANNVCGFNTGRVKHPIDGETSYNFSTIQMNCYIDDTMFTL